jgi:dephospho-CoA kinase
LIVGLTGGIGSGKSTVASLFRNLDIFVVDADQVARDVVEPGSEALTTIHEHFGDEILSGDELNRTHLRQLIFKNESEKQWLENLLHPIIRERLFEHLNASDSVYKILEAPLLLENNLDQYCDKTMVVDLPEKTQIARACARDQTNVEQVKKILSAQIGREERLARADYIIDNSGSKEQLEPQVLRLDQILRLIACTPEFL